MFSLKTKEGCKRFLVCCLICIFAFSAIGALISHQGGAVTIREVKFDVRGAVIVGELYTPRGINSNDKVPGILTAHGGSCAYGVYSGIAQELARRGFVVLNVNAYGAGTSEMTAIDDAGGAPGDFFTTRGVYDALCYLKSLKYVDQTRIGLTGHSMGGVRTGLAGAMDGSFFTLNDLLINVLYNEFGIALSEEEIYENADALAAKYLDEGQLRIYEHFKAQETEFYNTRAKAVLSMGIGTDSGCLQTATVNVGGHDVQRMMNINAGTLEGRYDENLRMGFQFDPSQFNNAQGAAYNLGTFAYQLDGPAKEGAAYMIDTTFQNKPEELGQLLDMSVLTDAKLKEAIDNRALRFFYISNETHSQNFLSTETTRAVVKYFEQTLGYNNGNLGDASAKPIDYKNIVWLWREICSGLAMATMWTLLFPLTALLLQSKAFGGLTYELSEPKITKKSKSFWIISAAIALAGIFGVMFTQGWTGVSAPHTIVKGSWFFPYEGTPALIFGWMIIVGIVSLAALIINSLVNKDASIKGYIEDYKVNIGFKNWLGTLLVSFIVFSVAYLLVEIIHRVFAQDFRFWLVGFDVMDPRQYFAMLRYVLPLSILFAIGGVVINAGRMKDMSEGWNTVLNLALTGIGLVIAAIICYAMAIPTNVSAPTSFFLLAFGLVLMVFVNAFINRKMYNLTGSVWMGALINAWLVAWLWCSMCDTAFLIR